MNPALYAVAMVSFLAGSFGYVIVRFLMLPVFRYAQLKKKIRRQLDRLPAPPEGHGKAAGSDASFKRLRQLSVDLNDCFSENLPHWYKVYLTGRRGESPLDAAKHMLSLSNARNPEHGRHHVEKIRGALNL